MQRQKTKAKKSKHNKKNHRRSYRAEHQSYDANNPLTQYVERVCGINSTEKKR